jgi:hypothetical protein
MKLLKLGRGEMRCAPASYGLLYLASGRNLLSLEGLTRYY